MTHAFHIDTLAFSQKLRAAGADEALATAIVEGITAADTSELATKGDLKEVETALRGEIKEVEASLRGEIKEVEASLRGEIKGVEASLSSDIQAVRGEIKDLEYRLTTRLGGIMVTGIVVISTLVALF